MAVISCPDCNGTVSDIAPTCPHCGRPFNHPAPVPPETPPLDVPPLLDVPQSSIAPPVISAPKPTLNGFKVFFLRLFSVTGYFVIISMVLGGLAYGAEGAAGGFAAGGFKGLIWGTIAGFVSLSRFYSNRTSYKLKTHVYVSAVFGGISIIVLIVIMMLEGSKDLVQEPWFAEPQQIRATHSVGEITAPVGWIRTDLNDAADIEIRHGTEELYLLVLTEPKSDFPLSYSLEDYSQHTRDLFIRSLISKMESPAEKITINGMDALQVEIRGTSSLTENVYTGGKLTMGVEIEQLMLHVSVSGKNHFHQILAWTLLDLEEENRAILESTIRTFKE